MSVEAPPIGDRIVGGVLCVDHHESLSPYTLQALCDLLVSSRLMLQASVIYSLKEMLIKLSQDCLMALKFVVGMVALDIHETHRKVVGNQLSYVRHEYGGARRMTHEVNHKRLFTPSLFMSHKQYCASVDGLTIYANCRFGNSFIDAFNAISPPTLSLETENQIVNDLGYLHCIFMHAVLTNPSYTVREAFQSVTGRWKAFYKQLQTQWDLQDTQKNAEMIDRLTTDQKQKHIRKLLSKN